MVVSQYLGGGRVVVSIISLFGTVQIAANGVANSLDLMGCIVGQAMNLAMGALGVWYAMLLDWVFRSICFVGRYLHGDWKKTISRLSQGKCVIS